MATPPTFVAEYEGGTWANGTTPKTTPSFDGALGDVLASLVVDASDDSSPDNYSWASSPVETWTEKAESTGGNNADPWAQAATAILTAARTGMTVTSTRVGGFGTDANGFVVAHFTHSDGVGNAAASGHLGGAPSWSFTTSFDNSAVVVVFADWNANDGASRVWRTVNGFTPDAGNGLELSYFRDATQYSVYVAYYPDTGAAGAKTLGLTNPAVGSYVAAAVEVRARVPAAPIVSIGEDSWCVVGGTFGRIPVEDDVGSAITAREWKVMSGPADAGNIVGVDLISTWAPSVQGSYVLRYTATNGIGSSFDELNLEAGVKVEGPQNSEMRR